MATLPGLVVVTDLHHEKIAVAEARRLNIPIIGICDTNVDPTLVDFRFLQMMTLSNQSNSSLITLR
jgi:ribosomal protein S2